MKTPSGFETYGNFDLGSGDTENQEETKRYTKRELSNSSCVRSFTLPELADHERIEVLYEDGILKVDIGKKEESNMASRQIELK